MITVDFRKRKDLTLCEYLYRSIKTQILNGKLSARERLPSRRALSQHLRVSVITVQNVYARLISEGYIYSIEKKGFFVEEIPSQDFAVKERRTEFLPPKKEPKEKKERKYFADLKSNSTSFEKFPFALWAKIMRQVLNSGDERLLSRVPLGGALELRKAICSHLRQFRMIDVEAQQIFVGAGTDFIYSMLLQFFGAGKKYAVENPGYKQLDSIAKLFGAKCVPVNLDENGISVEALRKSRAQIVHVSPQHHFPTGIVMPYKRRAQLLDWAAEREGRFVIEDDYDSEFRFDGMPIEPMFSSDRNSRVIYINTFSKTLSPSFRISYMVLPKKMLEDFFSRMGFFSCPVPSFEQFALGRFIEDGHYEKHLNTMKNYYRSLRNDFIAALQKSKIQSIAKIKEENSGLHFLLQIESKLSGSELRRRLNENGIDIALLSDFYYDAPCENSAAQKKFVVNYSGLKKERIVPTVRKMEKVFFQQ